LESGQLTAGSLDFNEHDTSAGADKDAVGNAPLGGRRPLEPEASVSLGDIATFFFNFFL